MAGGDTEDMGRRGRTGVPKAFSVLCSQNLLLTIHYG